MAARTQISLEEYLRTSYEDGDCEYVDGEVVPKPMPPKSHSIVQRRLIVLFDNLSQTHPFHVFPELRERLSDVRVLIPDIAVYAGPEPQEEVPTSPPFIAVEILSPDDRVSYLMAKLRDYEAWGVAHIWVIDPMHRTLSEYKDGTLREVAAYHLPEYDLTVTPDQILPQ